ncbi:hypothetical protein [Methylobacterium sp. R2-1]|uniref:hypothetical protein n=1 Tax=Methylobacterium sp. R2-1 TaxID=2587064 RepID=UPI0016188F9B|nr:hypothetical protein [Methylobacterium sp. R2-1]MBB2960055.1 hypothetical protein [Methylobacterium sp. R2-1]
MLMGGNPHPAFCREASTATPVVSAGTGPLRRRKTGFDANEQATMVPGFALQPDLQTSCDRLATLPTIAAAGGTMPRLWACATVHC